MAEESNPVAQAQTEIKSEASSSDESNTAAEAILDAKADEGSENESSEETEESGKEEAAAAKKEAAEVKKTLKKLKIKFNNKELEEELPFEIPDDEAAQEYMRKHLQMSKLAQAKAQDYSQLEKEIQQFVEGLRKNPRDILSNPELGIDVDKFVQEYVQQKLDEAQKSPEQLEKERLQKELNDLKSKLEKDQEEAKQKEYERLVAQETERYDNAIASAIKESELPPSPYVFKKMAGYMLLGLQNNIDLDPKDVIPLVKNEISNDLKEMFAVMPDEAVEAIVGKDTLNRIRKKNVSKAKQAAAVAPSQIKDVGASSKKEGDQTPQKKMTYKDFFGF